MPSIWAAASLAVTVVGTAMSAMQANAQATTASNMARYNAAVATNNSILAQRAADDARARGQVAAGQEALANKQLVGRERAALAANGSVIDTGSAADITTDTKASGKYNELTITSNAEREALGDEAQGMNFQAQAGMDQARADAASQAGTFGVASSLLSGAGTVAQKWYNFGRTGAVSFNSPFGANGGGIS